MNNFIDHVRVRVWLKDEPREIVLTAVVRVYSNPVRQSWHGPVSDFLNLDLRKIFSSVLIHTCFELFIFKSAFPAAHFDRSNKVLGQDITKYDYLIWHSSKKIKCNQSTVFFLFLFGSMPDINSLNSNEVSSSFLKPFLNKSFTKVLQGKTVPEIVLI